MALAARPFPKRCWRRKSSTSAPCSRRARLILIRGTDGTDGLSYLLQGTEHVAGRTNAQIPFPNDTWISDRHANFIYRGEKLVVRDEGSLNGVYVRVRQPVPLAAGESFLCGEQLFRADLTPRDGAGPEPDQTYFYSSPKRPSSFRVVQILRGGSDGMLHCARENSIQIGREDNEMNFPEDIYMSGRHARVDLGADGTFTLSSYTANDGAVPGKHSVSVSCYEGHRPGKAGSGDSMGKLLIPLKYTRFGSSGLTADVNDTSDGKPQEIVLELSGPPATFK